jgi:AAA15 family ATPase/GTPase
MLVEFSVQNFKSIKEKQSLSMLADKPHKELRCVHESGFNSVGKLLESAAIYGPNAAGKSNLVEALLFFKLFVANSSKDSQALEKISVNPFKFSSETFLEPTLFEIAFIYAGYLFEYGFSVDASRVYQEWLYATPQSGKKQTAQKWFERSVDTPVQESYIRKELKGAKESWKQNTRENALFLSTAVQNNSEDFLLPFTWITQSLRPYDGENSYKHIALLLDAKPDDKEKVMKFMKGLDVSFDDFYFIESAFSEEDLSNTHDEIRQKFLGKKRRDLYVDYEVGGQRYTLPFSEESRGTKSLFSYSFPILDTLSEGYTLIVDELDRSLHPVAMEGVLSLFQDCKINKNKAQLIFTTHNTHIMNMMDRDQVMLVDKTMEKGTSICSLADYKGFADEAIEKRYLNGRYSALPSIGDLV